MNQAPWITVVTVVKDDPEGLTRTYSSLAVDKDDGVEYLVVDSSSDRTAVDQALEESGLQPRVQWMPPEGIYRAMNKGLALARGTYVYFLNAGDEIAPGALSHIRSRLQTTNAAWAFGPVEIVGTDGTVTVTEAIDIKEERMHCFARGRFPAHQGTSAR